MGKTTYPPLARLARPDATQDTGFIEVGTDDTPLSVKSSLGGAAVSDANPQPTKGVGFKTTVTITRPANMTPYNAGDVIGDTGGSAIINLAALGLTAGHILITSLLLEIDINALPSGMAAFRLHLYDASPDAIADNAAWDLSSAGDRGKYLGFIDIAAPTDLGSTLIAQEERLALHRKLAAASTGLYGLLQTIGAFTPAANSEVYKLTVRSAVL